MEDNKLINEVVNIRLRRKQIRQILAVFDEMDTIKWVKNDEVIYLENDRANSFYYLKKGKVKTYTILNNDTEKQLLLYEEGMVFGLGSFYGNGIRYTSAVALLPSELVVIDQKCLQIITDQHPKLIHALAMILAQDLQIMIKQTIAASGDRANVRIARYLLREIRRHKIATDQDINLIKVTQDQVANQFGYSRATVNRVLRNLVSNKLVRVGYGVIEVIDQRRLFDYCQNQ
ncbi:MAG: Crp/Fnr family transcriptional regulator [Erysipelotrichaceae bacterium]|nr:Crp/Fnr family transcriptional regulator [Erysipelotrichaceae bacterium]